MKNNIDNMISTDKVEKILKEEHIQLIINEIQKFNEEVIKEHNCNVEVEYVKTYDLFKFRGNLVDDIKTTVVKAMSYDEASMMIKNSELWYFMIDIYVELKRFNILKDIGLKK